jgi:predicted porin
MKKSLLALAVLGAFAGAASAQSSVTLFGVVDLSANYQKSNGLRTTTLDSNQLNSNRIGFTGTEDLGSGLKASFWLEAGMNNGTGSGAATGGGLSFNRRSTVSLLGSFGELRLGHDYTPTFWTTAVFDPFGANGIGEFDNLTVFGPQQKNLGSVAGTDVRANNAVQYFTPANLGGFYGRAMVSPSEGVNGQKYVGGTLGFAAGPFDSNLSYGETKLFFGAPNFDVLVVGLSYDLGVVKLGALYNESKWDPSSLKTAGVSALVPVGAGTITATYTHAKYSDTVAAQGIGSGNQYGAGYTYNLSKRTAIYSTISHISNSGGATFALGDVAVAAGQSVNGVNVGLRHSF